MTTASDAFQSGTPGDPAGAAQPPGAVVTAELMPSAELAAAPNVMWP